MKDITGLFRCAKCTKWISTRIELPPKPETIRIDVTCPDCGDVIYSGVHDPKDASPRLKEFRQYCSNPACGALIEVLLPAHQQSAIPCPSCRGTIFIGDASALPSEAGDWIDAALQEEFVIQQFECPSCRHFWEMTLPNKSGAMHRIKCPNPVCSYPSIIDYVI